MDIIIEFVLQCVAYPNNYTLMVSRDGFVEVAINSTESTGDIVCITVKNLLENTRYSYYLIATNPFGSHESTQLNISKQVLASAPIKILSFQNFLATAAVRNVTICQVDNTQYFIQCIFLNGTDVRGCNYTLVAAEGGTENRTGYILMDDEEIIEVDDVQLYSELVAYGLSNESGDILAVKKPFNDDIEKCYVDTTDGMIAK